MEISRRPSIQQSTGQFRGVRNSGHQEENHLKCSEGTELRICTGSRAMSIPTTQSGNLITDGAEQSAEKPSASTVQNY